MGSPVCPLVRSPHSGGTSVKLKETIPGGVGRGWAGAGRVEPELGWPPAFRGSSRAGSQAHGGRAAPREGAGTMTPAQRPAPATEMGTEPGRGVAGASGWRGHRCLGDPQQQRLLSRRGEAVPSRQAPPPAPQDGLWPGEAGRQPPGHGAGPRRLLVLTAHDLHLLKCPFAWPLTTGPTGASSSQLPPWRAQPGRPQHGAPQPGQWPGVLSRK